MPEANGYNNLAKQEIQPLASAQIMQEANNPPRWGLSRYLAMVFLALVLGLSVFLAVMIGNQARESVLQKQYEFSALLAENLNHQIYRRFTLPTLVGFGRIALRQPVQYERLDQLIQQVIHGMNVQELRIYNHSKIISYCTDKDLLGRNDLASPEVEQGMVATEPSFRLDTKRPYRGAYFVFSPAEGEFILRTTAPLRTENRLSSSEAEGPIMGVLEFRQDITADMNNVIRFQWIIIAITIGSGLLIFVIMIAFLRKAETALALRIQEKERLLQMLHQHEKLAGMGRVIAGIAHEIRNPLGIISSSAQLLLKRSQDSDKASASILQAIYDESARLAQTVTDFLDYARPRAPKTDEVNLCAVLEQAVIFMQPALDQHNTELVKNYDPAGPPLCVKGDKELLYRAIYNILSNAEQAVKHDSGGKITIWAGLSQDWSTGDAAEILIRDNGPGFGSGDLSRFMDPFYTTKTGGTGLGLPIVNSIITSHGGSVKIFNVAPEDAPGAMIRIILPISK